MKVAAFKFLFLFFILASVVLVVISVLQKEWGTATASLSLIIAIISAWIAFETFRTMEDQKQPLLTITPDFNNRYNIFQLRLRNHGQYSSYNVKIDWNNYPTNPKGEKVTFNSWKSSDYEAYVLNGKEETSVFIDSTLSFFERYKDKDLYFSGFISYSLSKESKTRKSESFEFSLDHYLKSLSYEKEEVKTYFELQRIPIKLEEIKKEISMLRKEYLKRDSKDIS